MRRLPRLAMGTDPRPGLQPLVVDRLASARREAARRDGPPALVPAGLDARLAAVGPDPEPAPRPRTGHPLGAPGPAPDGRARPWSGVRSRDRPRTPEDPRPPGEGDLPQ